MLPLKPWMNEKCRHLQRGHRYRVARAFTDYDGVPFEFDDTWWFVGVAYAPYDDGITLYITRDGVTEACIRLEDRPGGQDYVVAALAEYFVEA